MLIYLVEPWENSGDLFIYFYPYLRKIVTEMEALFSPMKDSAEFCTKPALENVVILKMHLDNVFCFQCVVGGRTGTLSDR